MTGGRTLTAWERTRDDDPWHVASDREPYGWWCHLDEMSCTFPAPCECCDLDQDGA